MSDIYCAEQIKIPPTFPHILKLYAKAAIRTQPYDLLRWTCAYFRALANCETPPVKERLEYPPFSHPSGITPGYLKTLLNVFGHVEKVRLKCLLASWQGVALPETTLFRILLAGKFLSEGDCHFYKFLAIACGFLGKSLFETMIYVCELLTEEPEGGSAMIPLRIFVRLYEYLAKLDCSGECPCVITEEDTTELFRPSGQSVTEESSSTFDSRLYLAPSGAVEEEEDTGLVDVCGLIFSESRSSETVQSSKDHDVDTRRSEVDEAHQGPVVPSLTDEIEGRSMDREEQPQKREPETEERRDEDRTVDRDPGDQAAVVPDFHFLDTDYDAFDRDDDSLFHDDREEIEGEGESREEIDDYSPIGLENILLGICECLEPVRVSDRVPTPPPPDPLVEFLRRMQREVDEGRLETRLRLDGIGRPVSENRITAVGLWLAECARRQEGLVGPRNIRHFLCPDLEDREDNECGA